MMMRVEEVGLSLGHLDEEVEGEEGTSVDLLPVVCYLPLAE